MSRQTARAAAGIIACRPKLIIMHAASLALLALLATQTFAKTLCCTDPAGCCSGQSYVAASSAPRASAQAEPTGGTASTNSARRALRIPYSKRELYSLGSRPAYAGHQLNHIAFPLGGLGAGSISLGGWGQLRDWEINNHPAKGHNAPDTFFTLRVQRTGQAPITKLVQGPIGGGLNVSGGTSLPGGIGGGLPRYREVSFTGEYPIATLRFRDETTPVAVTLEAFSPFIPLSDRDSSLPVAILRYTLKNTGREPVSAVLSGSITNLVGDKSEGRTNDTRRSDGISGIMMTNPQQAAGAVTAGSMVLATPWQDAIVWPSFGPSGFQTYWQQLTSQDEPPASLPGSGGATGSVGAKATLQPGQSVTIPFIVSWYFPAFGAGNVYYSTQWRDAWDVAAYTGAQLDALYAGTKRFHDALFASSLPGYVLDAVSSQISTLKTPTCIRLEDGTFYANEGCGDNSGCCGGSCTHVWNYAQALPYLFPPLQRSMGNAHFANDLLDDGYMCFRMPLPLGTKGSRVFHPAADGQLGVVIQVYRDWLISGDRTWLASVWPDTKKALEFAWKYWDADKDGVIEGMQHNTYDIEFHGPNTMMGSLYLAALESTARLAEVMGEPETAREYRAIAARGSAWTDANLFDGGYYIQQVNPSARDAWPDQQRQRSLDAGTDRLFRDWPTSQYGTGCLSDQLIGQWYADMLGLGSLYRSQNVRQALRSVFDYNWKSSMADVTNFARLYAVNNEAGLIVCTWPKGNRPADAFWYSDEVWCGIEYQVAAGLIYQGMVDEGLAIAKGVRDRHTGDQRNPWNEFECGHHYARSMASYSLLLALSGFSYSAPEQRIGFAPRISQRDFRTFYSVGSGWGSYTQELRGKPRLELAVDYGTLTVRKLTTAVSARTVTASMGGAELAAHIEKGSDGAAIVFDRPVSIGAGQSLVISLR